MMKALSNPNRLKLFLSLASCCKPGKTHSHSDMADITRCVGEISKGLELAPSTISHHLKELRHAGLVQAERKGQMIECSVNAEAIKQLRDFFSMLQ
jgi:ArsR family transcriptional regulator